MRKPTTLVLVTGALAAFVVMAMVAIAIAANDDSIRSKFDRDAQVDANREKTSNQDRSDDDDSKSYRDSKSQRDSNDRGDSEPPVPARDAEEAGRAALKATGGGTVEDVDRDSEGGAVWEVEITRPDGSRADVLLDAHFNVISVDGEQEPSEGADDRDEDRDSD